MIAQGSALLNPAVLGDLTNATECVQLRLIETTDLHMHLMPYDYYSDRPKPGLGLLSAARLITEARAEATNALLFDNGDFLQGTPLGDIVMRAHKPGDALDHPAIAAMNALAYDAITLGNHEFNYGIGFLLAALAGARFPVVSANLLTRPPQPAGRDTTLVQPHALLERTVYDGRGRPHPLRIGVIGFCAPQVVQWDRHILDGCLWSRDIVEAARRHVPELREAGADLVVALAHSGIGPARHSHGMENAAIPLARVDGVDALLTGHNHLLFPSPVFAAQADVDVQAGTLAGKPAVMGGCWGAHIGLIDLTLARDGGRWHVLASRSETRAVAAAEALPPAPRAARRAAARVPSPPMPVAPPARVARVAASIAAAHATTLEAVREPVGTSTAPLHSYFTHLGVLSALALVSEAQRHFITERLNDPGLAELPVLSAAAPFKSGGRAGPDGYTDVPEGPVALRHVADLYHFPNAIAALRLSGAQILEWLERSASAFNRIRPGSSETPLRNPEFPGYNFEVIDALDVCFDLSQPARYDAHGALVAPVAQRVVAAHHAGQPIAPAQDFILCTNSYRVSGAGGFAGTDAADLAFFDHTPVREVLSRFVATTSPLAPSPRGRLRFAPLPGTSALFETGPGAQAHLEQIDGFTPEPRGFSRAGFLRLKLDLSKGSAR
ncbi:MAG: bifunctional 2',3'-cyclic-nucleotide 2'-phosphodiesterase/3'-nucleotidase [Pararhodobacter sp.]